MIEGLEKNIDTEIEMLREISNYIRRIDNCNEDERRLLSGAIRALKRSMKLINNSSIQILKDISLVNKLSSVPPTKKNVQLEKVNFKRADSQLDVVLNRKDREKFLKELSISEIFINKLKKRKPNKEEKYVEFKASRGYLKFANKIFLRRASEMIDKGRFKSLSTDLRRANIEILFETYVAMIFFTVLLSFFVSVLVMVFLLFIDVSFSVPFVEVYKADYLGRILKLFWIPIAIPLITFLGVYFYPKTEKKSIGKGVDQELPFAVIHMSAISGSGIEPSEIFKIIGTSKEYPYLRKEIRKILNQTNLYGYDLVTALNNASKSSPSENLSELFSGLSTTITSGASLSGFFEKRSESLLLSYRLEREKYTRLVETFLDIYISVVIAAPMIFLLLMVMMTVSGIGVGFSSAQLSLISVFGIALLNVVFLVFLQMKQPSY
ncbi:MAG: type II secretion system F family protein [archaeon]